MDPEDYDDDVEGYGEEIEETGYDDYPDDDDVGDEIDDVLDALSGDDDDDDLVGEDDDLVGARGTYRSRIMRRRRRRRRGRSRYRVKKIRAKQLRQYPLGLGTTNIAPGATAVITANPQLPFKLTRLSTPSVGLVIDNVQVGVVSQFVAAGAIPTEVFGPTATGIRLKGDTAVPGVAIQVTVTNPTIAAVDFGGALFGLVAQ